MGVGRGPMMTARRQAYPRGRPSLYLYLCGMRS